MPKKHQKQEKTKRFTHKNSNQKKQQHHKIKLKKKATLNTAPKTIHCQKCVAIVACLPCPWSTKLVMVLAALEDLKKLALSPNFSAVEKVL